MRYLRVTPVVLVLFFVVACGSKAAETTVGAPSEQPAQTQQALQLVIPTGWQPGESHDTEPEGKAYKNGTRAVTVFRQFQNWRQELGNCASTTGLPVEVAAKSPINGVPYTTLYCGEGTLILHILDYGSGDVVVTNDLLGEQILGEWAKAARPA